MFNNISVAEGYVIRGAVVEQIGRRISYMGYWHLDKKQRSP